MVSILTHRDRQSVRYLPFCYLCGVYFTAQDKRHRDHVPPKTCFRVRDREPLILQAHRQCNQNRSATDKQIGQIVGMKHGKAVSSRDRALHIQYLTPNVAAVVNVNIPTEVWRWVRACHAALYQVPYPDGARGALVTPFPSAPLRGDGQITFDSIKPQHAVFVETIKLNRAKCNLDTIRCNRGKFVYECVWCLSDNGNVWLCIFAVDIYEWKDLGNTKVQSPRGCAGFYSLPNGTVPPNATKGVTSSIIVPNIDRLDPFGR